MPEQFRDVAGCCAAATTRPSCFSTGDAASVGGQGGGYALVLSNAGICYSRLGQFERALATQQRAVSAQKARGPSKALAEALGSLGNTHGLNGNPREALPYLNEAFSVRRRRADEGRRRCGP